METELPSAPDVESLPNVVKHISDNGDMPADAVSTPCGEYNEDEHDQEIELPAATDVESLPNVVQRLSDNGVINAQQFINVVSLALKVDADEIEDYLIELYGDPGSGELDPLLALSSAQTVLHDLMASYTEQAG